MNSILGNTRRPDISFHANGKIDIASRIANILSIREGDIIDILSSQGELYLYVRLRASVAVGRHEARCYPSNNSGRHFRTYSRRLCDAILCRCGHPPTASLPAGKPCEISGRPAVPIILHPLSEHR